MCPICTSSNKAVTFECLIDVGVAYKPYKTRWLTIFLLIFWTPFTNVLFCKWNILSTPSRCIRKYKMNIQNFSLFVIFVRCHINWVEDFHLVLYLNSQKNKTKSRVYMCIKKTTTKRSRRSNRSLGKWKSIIFHICVLPIIFTS